MEQLYQLIIVLIISTTEITLTAHLVIDKYRRDFYELPTNERAFMK